MEKFLYDTAEKKDAEEIVYFHKKINKGVKLSVQNLLWEQWSLYPDLGTFGIIKVNDEIIATQEFIPVYLQQNGKNQFCAVSERTLLDPKFRGGKEFFNLYEDLVKKMQNNGCQCIYGMTYAYKAFKKFGFEATLPLRHIKCVFKPRQALEAIFKSSESLRVKFQRICIEMLSFVLFKLKFAYFQLKTSKRSYRYTVGMPSDDEFKIFLLQFEKKYNDSVTLKYDKKFMDWRIFNNPFRKYKVFCVYNGKILKAIALVDISSRTYQVEDLMWIDELELDFLLFSITSFCVEQKECNELHFWGNYTNSYVKRIFYGLKKIGGIDYPARIHFVKKVITDSIAEPLGDFSNWYLTPIWFPTID